MHDAIPLPVPVPPDRPPGRGRRPTYGSWLAGTLSGTGVTQLADRGDGALVLVLAGELDSGTMASFRRALGDARAARATRTIIDVSGVVYADSCLIRLLVQAHHRLPRVMVAGPLPLRCTDSWNSAGQRRSSESRRASKRRAGPKAPLPCPVNGGHPSLLRHCGTDGCGGRRTPRPEAVRADDRPLAQGATGPSTMTGPCRSMDSRRAGPTGIFVAGSIARGMVAAGYRPDLYDATGALFGLADMAVIMYAPRGNGSAGTASQLSEGFLIMGATPAIPGGFSRSCVGTPRRARSAWPRRHDEAGAGRVRSRPPSASGRRNGHGSRYRRRENLHAPPKSGPWSSAPTTMM